MLRLIIDVGNTNIKFGFFDKKLLFVKILSTKKYSKLALKKMLTLHHLEKIYIGSVVSQITRTMVSDLQALTKVHVHLIKATDFINEFNLTKFNINEIGTDLLSLALWVKKTYQQGIAISFGTASFAVVVKKNHFIGAAIGPSIELGAKQLVITTALIQNKHFSNAAYQLSFGQDTKTSLLSGCGHMAKGFVLSVMEYAQKYYGIFKTLVTGGNTNQLHFLEKIHHAQVVDHATLLGYFYLSQII